MLTPKVYFEQSFGRRNPWYHSDLFVISVAKKKKKKQLSYQEGLKVYSLLYNYPNGEIKTNTLVFCKKLDRRLAVLENYVPIHSIY